MKKTLLAAAMAVGFAGVAQAETSVTLYGIVDAGPGYKQTKVSQGDSWVKSRDIGLVSGIRNGNRWGMKGVEDLGNGTSAIFNLESGYTLGDGRSAQGNRLFGRYAYVGLTGANWGTLTLGRQLNVGADTVSSLNPFGVGYDQAGVLSGAFGASTYGRVDNAIKYLTPDLSGFKFGVLYAGQNSKETGELDDVYYRDEDTSHWLSLGASYDNGPVSLGASYDRFRTDIRTEVSDNKSTTHMWNIFGAYDFEVVKAYLGYGQIRGAAATSTIASSGLGSTGLNSVFNSFTGVPGGPNYAQTDGFRQQSWMAGLSANVGDSGKLMASYQGNATKNKGDEFDGAKGRLHIFSVGYDHKLSKRTTVYGLVSYGTGKLKFDNQETAKVKSTLVTIGLNHRF